MGKQACRSADRLVWTQFQHVRRYVVNFLLVKCTGATSNVMLVIALLVKLLLPNNVVVGHLLGGWNVTELLQRMGCLPVTKLVAVRRAAVDTDAVSAAVLSQTRITFLQRIGIRTCAR